MSTARIPILDVGVDPVTMVQTVELADRAIVTGNQTCIMAVNPEKVVAARRDLGLRRSLCAAEILIPDGIGVVIAGRRAGAAHMERVPGSELMPALCELAARRGYPVFLFGARPDTNAAACSNLRRRWPGLAIAGSHHGYIDDSETQALIERINASGARLLFVALGSPRQELWIDLHRGQLDVSVIQAVGGTFDVIAGTVRRAPAVWRRMNLEWLYRLLRQPTRLLRQTALPSFVWWMLREQPRGWRCAGRRHG